ncbi:alanine racemase [Sphingopyxis panaciterrae]
MGHSDMISAGSSYLRIDLGALRANYRLIRAQVSPARCAAVVKADGYGLGAAEVGAALYDEGCRSFFVAQLCEAGPLARAIGPGCTIFILNGVDPGSETLCADSGFIPVLSSMRQVERWRQFAAVRRQWLGAALQIDSGMSRLGLSPADAIALAGDAAFLRSVDLKLTMTHLACADDNAHPANDSQLANFRSASAAHPLVPASIANSGGAFLGSGFHLDLARPGVSLFGVAPTEDVAGLQPVVSLDARVLQIRDIEAGTGVGYGLDYIAPAGRRIATIAVGYADGWPRNLGGVGAAWHDGTRLPIVGRVSMDSMTVDISALPAAALAEGDFVELIGPSQSLADIARDAGTIAYEILTRLGPRHARAFIDESADGIKTARQAA